MVRPARIIAWIALWSLAALIGGRAQAQDWARDMFDHTSHDFGTVARGAKVEHRFGVQNIYLEDAHIKSARASCGSNVTVCSGNDVKAIINGKFMNEITECTISSGFIGIQSEGGDIEIRKIFLEPLK